MKQRDVLVFGLIIPLLWGCSAPIVIHPLESEDLPRLTSMANHPDGPYRIEPGDTLEIDYLYHPDMKQTDVVRPDGKISPKMVGELMVVGFTTDELSRVLVDRTSDRLRQPEVTVQVTKFSEKKIFVGGEVGKPGTVPYERGLTPLRAVIAAGGFRDTARVDSIILVRMERGGNAFLTRKLDLGRTVTDGADEILNLAPHDVLFVPKTYIANANVWVRQHFWEMIPVRFSVP
jgi:protein involved in polysaccharide export with SLBB domain